MKILYIIPAAYKGIGWGGVMTYALGTARELQRLGHNVTVLTPGTHTTRWTNNGVRIASVKDDIVSPHLRLLSRIFPKLADRLNWIRLIKEFLRNAGHFDIIEAPEWGAGGLACTGNKKTKIVTRLHRSSLQYALDNNLPVTSDLHIVNLLEMLSVVRADAITYPTKYIWKSHPLLMRIARIKRSPFQQIVNGVPITAISKKAHDVEGSVQYILTAGRVEYGKGLHTLIRAFRIVAKRHVHVHLNIIGRDMPMWHDNKFVSYKYMLVRYLNKHGLRARVHFHDQKPHNQMKKIISDCLLYITPSRGHENQPLVLLEAISRGKAVITSDAGGLPEIITDQKYGLLFRQDDINELSTAMEVLIANKKLRKQIEQNNRAYRSRFNIRSATIRTASFYRRIHTYD